MSEGGLPPAHVHRRSRLRRAVPWLAVAAIAAVLVARAAVVDAPRDRLHREPARAGEPGRVAFTGSLHLPRGGPYILGFWAPPSGAVVEIAGTRLAGAGLVKQRVRLDAGVVPIRVAGPARLVWSPPGRRGDPEYVPASALSPDPPATARFDAPGTARGDGAAAGAIVVIAIALGLWLARHRLSAAPRPVVLATLAVLALALVIRAWDLGAAGQTWDEDTYYAAGKNYVQNLVRGDFDDAAWRWNYEHPPVSKYLAGLGGLWIDGYGGARAVSALVMALACALLVPIGARLDRPATGVAAGVIAALTPHLVAHGQIVGHEAPTALAWALALWASLRVWDRGAAARDVLPRMALCGALLGVAVMVRFVNGLIAPAMGLTILLTAPAGARGRAIGWGLALIPVVAVGTAIVLWPRLWTSPLVHLGSAWAKLKGTHSDEPFLGVLTKTPPRWYFVAYLGATAPLGALVAAAGGVVAWIADAARRRALAIALLWLVAPLLVALSPVRQDGVRYVIPSLLVLALLGGAGVAALGRLAAARASGRASRVAAAAPVAALAAYLVIVCARIHPFYLDYYGEQVGGTAAVARARRFEVAWWGEGLEPAIAYVNRHAEPGDRVHRACVEPIHLTWFRGDLWEPVADPRAARWIVHYQPSWRPCPLPAGASRVYTVWAQGAPLAHVYRHDAAPPAPATP
ncbi:MAG TPA: glycosyltransferase family 39 protein [Kofleriaceae bacterium]|nr:glycosyltransferase family 39 protein [Kofleriaceae bacterium]